MATLDARAVGSATTSAPSAGAYLILGAGAVGYASAAGTAAAVVVATDLEWPAMTPRAQDAFAVFAKGVDLLVFDAQYLPEEYAAHKGWGHSTWADAAEAARRCGAAKLWLIHHAPGRTDAEIDALAADAAAAGKGAVVPAGERMTETLHE